MNVCIMCLIASLVVMAAVEGAPLNPAKISRGWSTHVHSDSKVEHGYVLFVPYSYQVGRKLPVLLFLNGKGQNGDDGVNQIRSQIGIQAWEMSEFFPFLVVAPQCRADSIWSGDNEDSRWAMEILETVIKAFEADEDRIYLTGVSAGGSGAWNIGSAYAERFAAVAALCGNGGDMSQLSKYRMPIWNFINDGDRENLVTGSRQARKKLIEQGQSPLFTEFHKSGHDCWNAAYRMPALYGWLLEQRKSRNGLDARFDYLTPQKLLGEWHQQGNGQWSLQDADILAGTAQGGENAVSENFLVSNQAHVSQELHADVWVNEETGFSLALLKEGDPRDVLRIVGRISRSGAGGVFRPSPQDCLGTLDIAAEQSLKPGLWNDVRVRLQDGRLKVHLNGWQAADLKLKSSGEDNNASFRFALVSTPEVKETRWRYVRIRELKRAADPF